MSCMWLNEEKYVIQMLFYSVEDEEEGIICQSLMIK